MYLSNISDGLIWLYDIGFSLTFIFCLFFAIATNGTFSFKLRCKIFVCITDKDMKLTESDRIFKLSYYCLFIQRIGLSFCTYLVNWSCPPHPAIFFANVRINPVPVLILRCFNFYRVDVGIRIWFSSCSWQKMNFWVRKRRKLHYDIKKLRFFWYQTSSKDL